MKIKKTNVMRELDKAKIKYEVLEYEIDENDLSAINVASKTNIDIREIFKTLALITNEQEIFIVCIPGSDEIDLKKMAHIVGRKKIELLKLDRLKETTGYIRGGCSPIGIKRRHQSFIDSSCLTKQKIYISGGQRGIQIKISPDVLINFLKMKVENIVIS